MSEKETSKEGEVTESSQATQEQNEQTAANGKVTYTPEQQEHLNALLKKERETALNSDEIKQLRELAAKAKKYEEELDKKRQEEMSEVDRLKEENLKLESFKTKAEEYESNVKSKVEVLEEKIPDDKKEDWDFFAKGKTLWEKYEALTSSKWKEFFFGTQQNISHPAGGSPPQGQGKISKHRERAEKLVSNNYPHLTGEDRESKIKRLEEQYELDEKGLQ